MLAEGAPAKWLHYSHGSCMYRSCLQSQDRGQSAGEGPGNADASPVSSPSVLVLLTWGHFMRVGAES